MTVQHINKEAGLLFSDLLKDHKNRSINLIVGDISAFIPKDATYDEAEDILTKEAIDWLDSHKPLHWYVSGDKYQIFYKASREYSRLRGFDYAGPRKQSSDSLLRW